jgi:hypothetical protein
MRIILRNCFNLLLLLKLVIIVKGTVSRDFRPTVFFHQRIPHRALIKRLKPFRIWLRIRQDVWQTLNFIGAIGTAEIIHLIVIAILRCQLHRWNIYDTAAPLKSQTDFTSMFGLLKGKSSKNIPMTNVPILYTHFKQKWGLLRSHFRFQLCHWRHSKRISRRILSHVRNGFSLLIRGLGGIDWWKKPEVENLVALSLYTIHPISLHNNWESIVSNNSRLHCVSFPWNERKKLVK